MPHLIFTGCRPEPLAGYLKALAVLRLIAEQKDPKAKGWWEGDAFHLESTADEAGLVRFFVTEYSPTPIVAPWNGGSGFYPGDRVKARDAIRNSTDVRFSDYRAAIESNLSWSELPKTKSSLAELLDAAKQAAGGKKDQAAKKLRNLASEITEICTLIKEDPRSLSVDELKSRTRQSPEVGNLYRLARKLRTEVKGGFRKAGKNGIIQACRSRLSDRAVQWVDAAVMLGADKDMSFPPLLGSGANEGRLDYTNTFIGYVSDLWLEAKDDDRVTALLRHALFGTLASGLVNKPAGQYDPGRAGGYNQGPGIEDKEFPVNPWDFILALEGTISWAPGIARRHGRARGVLCSPFTVHSSSVGYSSAADREDAEARAEIWAPLWSKPACYAELSALLSEGRAEVGMGHRANNGIDFAKAVASLGVDRGIGEFVRYSLLKRRGDSYLAVPVGRIPVKFRSESDLVRELGAFLNRVDGWVRGFRGQAPARYTSARRGIDLATYDLLLHGGHSRVKALVAALGRLEKLLAERDLNQDPKLRTPLYGLSTRWLVAADDGSPEVRLAIALASIRPTGRVGPLRANLAPVDPLKPWGWAKTTTQVSWHGNTLAERLAGVLSRRMMDADRFGTPGNPLSGAVSLTAEDIVAFIDGSIKEDLLEDLLFGFTWVRWHDKQELDTARTVLRGRWATPVTQRVISRPWALLKLLYLPTGLTGPSGEPVQIRPEPALIPLLCAGRVREACQIAQRRLIASGLAPCRVSYPDSPDGKRLAAALLLPLRNWSQLSQLVCRG